MIEPTVTLTLTLHQLRILDAGLTLIDDVAQECPPQASYSTPLKSHAVEAMRLRDTVTAPAINQLNPGEIDI